jgi:hypothetical protein
MPKVFAKLQSTISTITTYHTFVVIAKMGH